MYDTQARPVGVTVIQVLLVVGAVLDLLGGLAYVLNRHDLPTQLQTDMTSTELAGAGFVLLLAAGFWFWVAYDLGRGKAAAQWILTVIATLHILAALWVAIAHDGPARNDLAAQGLISLVVLLLLHTHAADRFFHQRGHL